MECGVLADKYEEDKTASEEVNTSDDPEDKLGGGETLHVPMVAMDNVVDTLKYPEDAHHSEQLAVQKLKQRERATFKQSLSFHKRNPPSSVENNNIFQPSYLTIIDIFI